MANKILTDRVSVRVSAKQSDQSSQNKSTGKTVANALGAQGLSDAEAEAIGAAIDDDKMAIDEDGNLWLDEDQIIAAGKNMYNNGKFPSKYKYGNIAAIRVGNMRSIATAWGDRYGPIGWGIVSDSVPEHAGERYESYADISPDAKVGIVHDINNDAYTLLFDGDYAHGYMCFYSGGGWFGANGPGTNIYPSPGGIPVTDVGQTLLSLAAYGSQTEVPGSQIDWTKSDEEIKQQIHELHETWDVTTNPAITESPGMYGDPENRSYVLAGPIEYN